MYEFTHDLIRQVQISTRAAAGLSNYDPSEPTLPTLPSLSAAIATSDHSPLQFRCRNCEGRLLRGPESIICLYCGRGPNFDVAPEPICFTSSIGYQWLLRSLRLDGSEVVDRTTKSEKDQGQISKTLTSLSDLLNFKISWLAGTEKKEVSFSDKHAEERKRCLNVTGVAQDKFFLTLQRNIPSDISTEQPSVHKPIADAGGKDVTAQDHQNLFQNFQSSEPTYNSSKGETSDAFSGWEADFQSADFENQDDSEKSFEHFVASSTDSRNQNQDTKPFESSTDMEIDLAARIDSVFLPRNDPNYSKPKENPAVSPEVDDWNSDGIWNNLSSNESHFVGGVDSTVSTKDHQSIGDHTPESANDPFTDADFLQDFQLNPNNAVMTEKVSMNKDDMPVDKDLEEWDDFMGLTNSQFPLENPLYGNERQVSTSGEKSSEIDLFGFSNKSEEEDRSSFSQLDLFSSVTSNSIAPVELKTNKSENLAANWFDDSANSPSDESGCSANKGDTVDEPAKNDVKVLISQLHDLSFMLETELSIPSGSDAK